MIRAGLVAVAVLGGGPVLGQSSGLGPFLACPAVEGTIVWGLIDGGEGGDTSALSDVIGAGNGGDCLTELEGLGYGVGGLYEPDCAAVIALVAADVLPEAAWPDVPQILTMAISGEDPQACADTLASILQGGT